MSVLSIMDTTHGDVRLEWDPSDPNSVEIASAGFANAKSKGMVAYQLDDAGNTGEVIHEFNPDARRITMRAPLVGG